MYFPGGIKFIFMINRANIISDKALMLFMFSLCSLRDSLCNISADVFAEHICTGCLKTVYCIVLKICSVKQK